MPKLAHPTDVWVSAADAGSNQGLQLVEFLHSGGSSVGLADSPPVGALPSGPTSIIQTQKGQLIAFALPKRSAGRVWRIVRRFDATVVRQVSEADVGNSVVLVFKATGSGTTTLAFGLTRGETSKAFESRRFTVRVR